MAQDSADAFRYSPLETTSHIRLLRFGGSNQQPSGESIAHFDLAHSPSFAALSYCWGEKTHPSQLRLSDGRTLRLSPTVLQAISRIKVARKYDYLWIDQVCINQEDVQERGHQVSLMHEIYSRAEEVFAWAGEDEQGIAGALRRLADAFIPASRPETHICISRSDCADLLRVQTRRSHPPSRSDTFGFREIAVMHQVLNYPWFRRAWVVQEVALAQKVTLLLGTETFSLPDFNYLVSLAALTERETEEDSLFGDGFRYSTGFECFHRTIHQREQYHAHTIYEDFLPFLCHIAGSCEATDPRDLIYAFSGLYKRDQGLLIEPDYSISVELTFTRAAKAFIAQSNTLDLFSAITGAGTTESYATPQARDADVPCPELDSHESDAGSVHSSCSPSSDSPKPDSLNLPSWVPNWTIKLRNRPFRHGYNTPRFRASGPFPYHQIHTEPPDRLTVAGKVIARVASIHPAIHADHLGHDINALQTQLRLDELFTQLRKQRAKTSPRLTLERILRVILADGAGRRESASNIEPEKQRLTEQRIAEFISAWDMIGQPLGHENTAERVQEDARELQQRLKIAEGRCVISTVGAAALGLAPGHVRLGDVVCVLHGSRTPVVLREGPGGTYTVIGQCFLEGAMYGEAVTWEEVEADAFVLV